MITLIIIIIIIDTYQRAGSTAQVPVTKPERKHKKDTKITQIHKHDRQNRNENGTVTIVT